LLRLAVAKFLEESPPATALPAEARNACAYGPVFSQFHLAVYGKIVRMRTLFTQKLCLEFVKLQEKGLLQAIIEVMP
jgi:hypothetical protein